VANANEYVGLNSVNDLLLIAKNDDVR